MKRSGQLEKDIKHWMEMRRGSKPIKPYNYGNNKEFEDFDFILVKSCKYNTNSKLQFF